MREATDPGKAEALAREGWHWSHDLQTYVKESSDTVNNFGQSYRPTWQSTVEDKREVPISNTANASKLLKIQEAEATVVERKLAKEQFKNDARYLDPRTKEQRKNELGLNHNLNQTEALQLRRIIAAHRKAKQEERKQNVAKARHYGDASALENLVRLFQNADPREKLLIKQALMDAGDNLHE